MRIKKKNIIFEERVKSNMPVPNEVKQLHSLFVKNGFQLYIVGGAVRDYLMGKTPKDYDLATELPADFNADTIEFDDFVNRVRKFNLGGNDFNYWVEHVRGDKNWRDDPHFKDKIPELSTKTQTYVLKTGGIKFLKTGAAFGVINAFVNGEEYEIATFREDVGSGRRPDSVIFSDIETDVKRRDLTINALFYDISTKEIVDLVGGIEDINNGVVRTVGDAGERFGEDRLRILRAIRFAGRTGSKLDPAIDKSLRQDNSLEGVSGERIMDEFVKGIKSAKSTKYFLSLIDKYKLFDWIFRGMSPINKQFVDSNNELIVIAVLLKDVSYDTINKQLNTLKYSSNQIKPIVFMVAFNQLFSKDTFYTLKKMSLNSGLETSVFKEFAKYVGIDVSLVDKFMRFQLSITGDFVKQKFGMKDGPELGAKIKQLETQKFFSI